MMQLAVRYYRGDLAGAENSFVLGLTFLEDPVVRQNLAIVVYGTGSWNAWMLGRADVARERLAKVRDAVNAASPHDLAMSDMQAEVLHALLREYETVEALAVQTLDLCEKYRFPNEAAFARFYLGLARALLGRAAEGIALILQARDALVQTGNRNGLQGLMTYLAAAQLRAGAVGDSLETVEQALNFNPDIAIGRPETLRIRGELRLTQGELQLAEVDFRDSIAMARSMGAKAWELRTTMSFARLLDNRGRRDEARTMLADIYNWFTEGFDTPDLKDAKALLDELSS
jgi:tetratricopeptide (TPR) repeat protein